MVAGDDLDGDILTGEVLERVGRIGPDPVPEHHEGHRRQPCREIVPADGRVGPGECQNAHTSGSMPVRRPHDVRMCPRHDFRCAQHPGTTTGERDSAPFAFGGERDGIDDRPVGGVGVLGCDGSHGCIRCGVGSGNGGESCRHVDAAVVNLDIEDAQLTLGERSRFVETDGVDSGEALHRRKLLHQHLSPAKSDHGDGERHGREEHQPLRHHGHQTGHRALGRLPEALIERHLAPDEQDPRRHQSPADQQQDPIDAVAQLRTGDAELLRLDGELGRVGVGTHPTGDELPGSGHDETARPTLVTRVLRNRVGLTRQQRLVDLQSRRLDDFTIDDDLVAGFQHQQVVEHHLSDRDFHRPAVPHCGRLRSTQESEAIECALGSQLLNDADRRVDDHHRPEERILYRGHDEDDHEQHRQDQVEAREDVVLQDGFRRTTGALGHDVELAGRHPLGDLARGETGRLIDRRRFGNHDVRLPRRPVPARHRAARPLTSGERPGRNGGTV